MKTLKSLCRTIQPGEENTFVGIQEHAGLFSVIFPLGYNLGETENEIRDDLLLLIRVLSGFSKSEWFSDSNNIDGMMSDSLPFFSYRIIWDDYIQNSYFQESTVNNKSAYDGTIDWKRTIAKEEPYFVDNSLVFLNYQIRKKTPLYNTPIFFISQYCVYLASKMIGWLYGYETLPTNPLKMGIKEAIAIVREHISNTFNDRKRLLLSSMENVLKNEELLQQQESRIRLWGTYRFEYVWEGMIDTHFGIKEKNRYFPQAFWVINQDSKKFNSSVMEPDTIMIIQDNEEASCYVLDAKYYKYGITNNRYHLPPTSSICKQIVYGEYAAQYWGNENTFNAFIMPYQSIDASSEWVKQIGFALTNWCSESFPYSRVQGVLIDMKKIMQVYSRNNSLDLQILARIIRTASSKQSNVKNNTTRLPKGVLAADPEFPYMVNKNL